MYRIVAERGERLEIVPEWEFEKPALKFLAALRRQQSKRREPVVYRLLTLGHAWWDWTSDPKMVREARDAAKLRMAQRHLARTFDEFSARSLAAILSWGRGSK